MRYQHQKNRKYVLVKMCRRWNPCALLVGMQNGKATVEKGSQVGQWEGICLPNAGDTGSIPGLGRSLGEGWSLLFLAVLRLHVALASLVLEPGL